MKIEWNKVTWYSKMLALILFVALPFIGFYYGMNYGEMIAVLGRTPTTGTIATSTAQNSTASYYNTPSEWQTDANNTAGGFSIAYPIDFSAQDNYSAAPSTDWRINANNTSGIKYFSLTVPPAFEPQTNLADVTLTVGGSKNNTAIAECLNADQSGGPIIATSSVTINGVAFTVFKSSDAGAGNIYQTTSYRTLHAGECYAVEYTIHSSQIGNYPSSYNLQPYNEQAVDSLMQTIVGTFKFL
jgi:hypothetical protein